ncbi:MAG: polysaccharide pyruvyl transferase CsaB [Clostridiales bacterium]|nr:polysaccharide pyruvyl transferase CsaB [Clostridiales bacterium]
MKKVVISGYYGFDNVGDDAMVETFSTILKNKELDVTVLSKNPDKTKKQFNINAIDRSNPFKIMSEIKKSDILISGGGTLLQDITTVASIWYYLFIILLGIFLKKETYILFQGMGPINNKFNIWLTRKILSKVNYIVLRDNKSLEEMKRLEFDISRTIVATDLIFGLKVPEEKENTQLIKKYIQNYSNEKTYIGVSLRPWKNIRNEVNFARVLDKIANEHNAEIVFIPFHKSQDYAFTVKVIEKMETKNHLIYGEFLPSQVAGLMSLMSLNIGVRLHSLVFSTIANVPTIGISYDPKIDGFLQDIGMKAVSDYSKLNEEAILKEVGKIFNDKYDKKVFENTDSRKKIINEIMGDILDGKCK